MSEEAIVIDTGSALCKAGFAGSDVPRAIFPTVVGVPKHDTRMKGMGSKAPYFVGREAQAKRGILSLQYPIEQRNVVNWDYLEALWQHTFYNELLISPEQERVLLSDPVLGSGNEQREKMGEIMFEKFGVNALYIQHQAALAMYAAGCTSGVAVDSGEGVTLAVPMFEGRIIPHAIQRLDIAGRGLTDHLALLLKGKDLCLTSASELEIVRAMKEKMCYVASNYEDEMRRCRESSAIDCTYELPDGNQVKLSNERFRCTEALFDPSLLGLHVPGLHEVVFNAIQQSEIDLRRSLCEYIILCGGNTMFQGMQERVTSEVQKLASLPVRIRAQPDRNIGVWIGGSILGSFTCFQAMFATKHQYEEYGSKAMSRMILSFH